MSEKKVSPEVASEVGHIAFQIGKETGYDHPIDVDYYGGKFVAIIRDDGVAFSDPKVESVRQK